MKLINNKEEFAQLEKENTDSYPLACHFGKPEKYPCVVHEQFDDIAEAWIYSFYYPLPCPYCGHEEIEGRCSLV